MTVNGDGAVNLEILSKLRYLVKLGYKIVYVTGRSSTEAFILAVFGGTTKVSIGENGGVITKSPTAHTLLADKEKCMRGYNLLAKEFDDIEHKQVFPRMTEVVLTRTRTFDIDKGNKIFEKNNMDLVIVDSNYAFHINEKKINKAYGLKYLLNSIKIKPSEVVAIGDSETDIPMFELCEHSVTFESSKDTVKKMAKFIVNGENGEGFINALDLIVREKSLG
ncbi:MAG: HAD-IIB family hydrolase [Thermoproteota archaeon]|nr:HAD-IIB family hydrolase [Thermoproteota archaeon]